jgi:hypothetical protein
MTLILLVEASVSLADIIVPEKAFEGLEILVIAPVKEFCYRGIEIEASAE